MQQQGEKERKSEKTKWQGKHWQAEQKSEKARGRDDVPARLQVKANTEHDGEEHLLQTQIANKYHCQEIRASTGCSSSSSRSTMTIDGSAVNSASSSSSHKPALRIEGSFVAGAASFLDARYRSPPTLLGTFASITRCLRPSLRQR